MFEPYKGRRAFEDIAEEIKGAILNNRFSNGDRLPSERELAEQFKVGRVTIREAFRTLETRGLIQVKKGSAGGAFVHASDYNDMATIIMDRLQLEGTTHEQMIEARIGLESAMLTSVIKRATEEDFVRLREDIEASREILEPGQAEETVARMINFHILLGEASHNIPYKMFIRSIMEWASRKLRKWIPSPKEQAYSIQSHMEILEAVAARDEKNAQRLMRYHIEEMSILVRSQSEAF